MRCFLLLLRDKMCDAAVSTHNRQLDPPIFDIKKAGDNTTKAATEKYCEWQSDLTTRDY